MADDEVTVTLVGGPADWAGKTLQMPRQDVHGRPRDEVGAYLISAATPERGPDEDWAPRAVYGPDDDGDPATWTFHGWFPASPSDPPPASYATG